MNHEMSLIYSRINEIENDNKKIIEKLEQHRRIIDNAKDWIITFTSTTDKTYFGDLIFVPTKQKTRIYKDRKEYEIDKLILHNASFKCSNENEYQLYVEDIDNTDVKKYIVDLDSLSFTEISGFSLENGNTMNEEE